MIQRCLLIFCFALMAALIASSCAHKPIDSAGYVLTPPPPAAPRINGPGVFGVRPNSPFLYTVPATGVRPIQFGAEGLPAGLSIDPQTGRITGSVAAAGEYKTVLTARNSAGTATKNFRIVVGQEIALTPPMGWNSWNSWGDSVDQDKVLKSAEIIVSTGLINHGWTYVNIDDTWQGKRTGKDFALQANEKFPDMEGLCDRIHAMGLKAGIYSTPWMTSYANFPGGSGDNPQGEWNRERLGAAKGKKLGPYRFAAADARQYADWGFDYLKYDWVPNDLPSTVEMNDALIATGRDIVFSLSNKAPFDNRFELAKNCNAWRTTGDIWDAWGPRPDQRNLFSITGIIDAQEAWSTAARPGHWNDPDMLVVGWVGIRTKMHPTRLTPDEQYSHISMWCMMSAPLLIGCDMTKLDDFTLNLLTNDEVLAIDQDALGIQAVRFAQIGAVHVYGKPLEDGSIALCFLNRGEKKSSVTLENLAYHGIDGRRRVRDLWRQKDMPEVDGKISATVPPHGVMLYKLTRAGD